MSDERRGFIFGDQQNRYLFAIGSIGVAALVRLAIDPIVGDRLAFEPFLLPVGIAAWLWGWKPAGLTLVISAVVADFLFVAPRFSLAIADPLQILELMFFLAVGGVFLVKSLRSQAVHDAEEARHLAHERSDRKTYQDQLDQALESALNAKVMIDAAGVILVANALTEQLFGYHREELIGQLVEHLIPERFRAGHPKLRNQFLNNPHLRPMGEGRDLWARRKDGSEFPVEIGLNPIKTERGLVVITSIVDITRRKKAEEKFQRAVESAPNGMVMIEGEGKIVLVNAQTESMFGYHRDELLGEPVEILVPERFRDRHPGDRGDYLANPKVRAMGMGRDLFGRRKDGSEFPIEIGLNPIQTDEGILVLSVIVDITARKHAEEGLRQSQQHFKSLAEGMPLLVWTCGSDGSCDYVSPQWTVYTGAPEHELLGNGWADKVHGEDRSGVLDAWRRNTSEGTDFDREFRLRGADGRYRWFQARGVPLRGGDGRIVKWFGTNMDIDDRKLADAAIQSHLQQLADTNSELKARTQENEAFVYSVSHDLRSPLVNLRGFSKELSSAVSDLRAEIDGQEGTPSRERQLTILKGSMESSIRFIQTAVTRLSGIMDALLRLSRAGRVIYQKQAVDVAATVARIVESMRGTIGERAAQITIDKLPSAWADAAAVEQIFANLIGNALNYLDPKRPGQITIGSLPADERGDQQQVYFVSDNGLGISEAGRTKIFQPFQRLHPQAAPGEGMGLAVIHRVVERMGGRLWFESTAGSGTVFYVSIPKKHKNSTHD